MPLPGSFVKKIAQKLIIGEAQKNTRTPNVINLSEVKKAGITAEISNQEQLEQVRNLIRLLKEQGVNVRALYFFNDKKIPQHFTPTGIEEGFSRKELGWNWLLPDLLTAGFIAETSDLLIDLSPESSLPLKWIAARSKASFKAGLFSRHYQPIYDFMISCQETCSLQETIDQMVYYLQMLNKKS
ncbi:MAG: hypothetical protein HPY80_06375 [Bacteroidales bacterium]|nr:hypothetical protein [Bacteroidales bacterium]